MDVPDARTALEELRWLERLALRLVGDPGEAQDLSQETVLAAQRNPGVPAERRRPWLVSTLKNLVSKSRRGRARRPGYEREGAHPEALASAAELAERAELQRELLGYVNELDERYRTPLLLRYYDGASVANIAERVGAPVRTVHTRLQRGLQRLRDRMGVNEPKERDRWLGGLLLLPREAQPAPAFPVANGWATAGWAAAAVALGGLGWFLVAESHESPESHEDAPRQPVAARAEVAVSDTLATNKETPSVTADRQPVGATPLAEPDTSHVAAAGPLGQVVDWNGQPVARAQVRAKPFRGVRFFQPTWMPIELIPGDPNHDGPLPGTTDDAGQFALPDDRGEVLLVAEAPGLITAIGGVWSPEKTERGAPFVAMAEARPFTGRVVGPGGQPVEGRAVWITLDEEIAARFGYSFDAQHPLSWSAETDADGRFAFGAVPWVSAARVTVEVDELDGVSWPLLDAPDVLELHDHESTGLRGLVLGLDGRPLADATVDAGNRSVRTATDGSFRLTVPGRAPEALWVAAEGHAPRRFALDPPPVQGIPEFPFEVGTLVLEQPDAQLSGVVVDENGMPLAGHLVWIDDPTVPGGASRTLSLESLAAGHEGYHHSMRTRSDGTFELGGLRSDRSYRLRVLDDRTAQWTLAGPFTPGRDEPRAVLSSADRIPVFRGQLVSLDGEPLAGATVAVIGPGYGIGESRAFANGSLTTTDEQGRFELEHVPAAGVSLSARHPDAMWTMTEIETLVAEPVWSIPFASRLSLELTDAEGVESIRLLDADGAPVSFYLPTGLGRRRSEELPLYDGRSPVTDLPNSAAVLVIRRRDRDPERVPFELFPGEHTHLRH